MTANMFNHYDPVKGISLTEKRPYYTPYGGGKVQQLEIRERLRRTAVSSIYRAFHLRDNDRMVIVKVFKKDFDDNGLICDNTTFTEAQIANLMDGKKVVKYLGKGTIKSDNGLQPDRQFIVMEDMEGGSINDWLRTWGEIPVSEGLRIGKDIAQCLCALHSGTEGNDANPGWIYGDVKPDRILIGRHMENFEYAPVLLGEPGFYPFPDGYWRRLSPLGTPAYRPREQWQNPATGLNWKSDVYSLGISLYQMIVGALPYRGGINSLRLKHERGDVVPTLRDFYENDRNMTKWFIRNIWSLIVDHRSFQDGPLTKLIWEMMSPDIEARPSMQDVVARLTGIWEMVKDVTPRQRYLSLPPRGVQAINMVFVPLPTMDGRQIFRMGSQDKENGHVPQSEYQLNEKTIVVKNPEREHMITLTRRIYMGIFPVTQEQFAAVMGDNYNNHHSFFCPLGPRPGYYREKEDTGNTAKDQVTRAVGAALRSDDVIEKSIGRALPLSTQRMIWETLPDFHRQHPVESVTWQEASDFCAQLTEIVQGWGGQHYSQMIIRLPTEAEWEYACRAGHENHPENAYYNTHAPRPEQINGGQWRVIREDFSCDPKAIPLYPTPMGEYAPNRWGLYDMLGNVHEWCLDVYGDYSRLPNIDPGYAERGDLRDRRAMRGGSWHDGMYDAEANTIKESGAFRCANRGHAWGNHFSANIGFRIVVELPDGVEWPWIPIF